MKENPRSTDIFDDSTITAVYSAEYLLQLSSEKGAVTGGGYYAEGETAVATISPTEVMGFPIDSSFGGWTGDLSVQLYLSATFGYCIYANIDELVKLDP